MLTVIRKSIPATIEIIPGETASTDYEAIVCDDQGCNFRVYQEEADPALYGMIYSGYIDADTEALVDAIIVKNSISVSGEVTTLQQEAYDELFGVRRVDEKNPIGQLRAIWRKFFGHR